MHIQKELSSHLFVELLNALLKVEVLCRYRHWGGARGRRCLPMAAARPSPWGAPSRWTPATWWQAGPAPSSASCKHPY